MFTHPNVMPAPDLSFPRPPKDIGACPRLPYIGGQAPNFGRRGRVPACGRQASSGGKAGIQSGVSSSGHPEYLDPRFRGGDKRSGEQIPIRVGYIDYVNTFPFFHNLTQVLEGQEVEFVNGVPSEINVLMRTGKIDVALISSLEYAAVQDCYYILTDGCIASKGATKSVILFSEKRIEDLNGSTVALSQESLSSAFLLKIILKLKYGFSNRFVENLRLLSQMLEQADAGLVIGDQALFQERRRDIFEYDLCDEWTTWQGLPFCFALWVVRRSFAEKHPEHTRLIARALETNLERNLQDLELLYSNLPQGKRKEAPPSKILDYWRRLIYCLDPEVLKGLERFYELARQMHVLDREILLEYAYTVEVP